MGGGAGGGVAVPDLLELPQAREEESLSSHKVSVEHNLSAHENDKQACDTKVGAGPGCWTPDISSTTNLLETSDSNNDLSQAGQWQHWTLARQPIPRQAGCKRETAGLAVMCGAAEARSEVMRPSAAASRARRAAGRLRDSPSASSTRPSSDIRPAGTGSHL